ncbi:MAG: hypothetical protein GY797_31540 [Deltaproteobacteria bacterium]|nr:hypothetical protein [Deltaproteobacteria bacterium]
MQLLPYQNFKIRTYLTPDQVYQKLQEAVRLNRPFFSFGTSDKPYYGKVTENYFKIYRIISYRNSFLPSTEGKIQPDGVGSVIDITIQSDMRIVGVFMLIFLVVFPCAMFNMGSVLTDFITHPGTATLFLLLRRIFSASFVLVSTYGMIQLFYLYEATKAKTFVSKLVEKSDYY